MKLPGSSATLPGPTPVGPVSYGNDDAIVTGVDGSICSRRSFQTESPFVEPSRCCSAPRNSALFASLPPPAPNTAPISVPIATTSFRVNGFTNPPCALKYALIPARYASTSRISCRPFAVFCASGTCAARNVSVCALGTNCFPESATENAS